MVTTTIMGLVLLTLISIICSKLDKKFPTSGLAYVSFPISMIALVLGLFLSFIVPLAVSVKDEVPSSINKSKDGITTITWKGNVENYTSARVYLIPESNMFFRVTQVKNSWGIRMDDRYEIYIKE